MTDVTRRQFAGLGVAAAGTLLEPSVAKAATSPTISTASASNVTATTATVSGTVNPNGRKTSAWFDYGFTTSYGTKTTAQYLGSATTDQPVSADLTGLASAQTYHVRISARRGYVTWHGPDGTFQTRVESGVPVNISRPTIS